MTFFAKHGKPAALWQHKLRTGLAEQKMSFWFSLLLQGDTVSATQETAIWVRYNIEVTRLANLPRRRSREARSPICLGLPELKSTELDVQLWAGHRNPFSHLLKTKKPSFVSPHPPRGPFLSALLQVYREDKLKLRSQRGGSRRPHVTPALLSAAEPATPGLTGIPLPPLSWGIFFIAF